MCHNQGFRARAAGVEPVNSSSMASLWHLGGLTWRKLVVRVLRQSMRDELMGRAAELAYFFLFATFPLLLFLTTLLGFMARGNFELRSELFQWIGTVSPSSTVTDLLRDTLNEVTQKSGGGKLSFGLVAAVWIASNGMLAVGRTLNTACGLKEARPWWMRRGVAIALVFGFSVLAVIALGGIFFGAEIAEAVADALGMGGGFAWIWRVTQWILGFVFVAFAFDLIYNFAPNLARGHYTWLTPGAVVGVALWLAASFGFQVYLGSFGFYSRTYGSLGAVIVLLLWFFLTAAAILIGGEVNSEISTAARGGASREERSRERREHRRLARRRSKTAGDGGAPDGDAGGDPGEARQESTEVSTDEHDPETRAAGY